MSIPHKQQVDKPPDGGLAVTSRNNQTGVRAEEQRDRTCPFLVEPLERDDTPKPSDDMLRQLLPASFRTRADDLTASTKAVAACVQRELDLGRLETIFNWLWIVGRPMPPRPLHHQLLLSRDIFITEQIDMHLVWTSGRIFIKPIPRFLLATHFWSDHLSCPLGCTCGAMLAVLDESRHAGNCECNRKRLWKSALGFIFSYAALVSHESDFVIAQEKHLVPSEVTWSDWTALIDQVLATKDIYHKIHQRFIYGELRLSRLNKIYSLTQQPFLRGYMSQWQRYGDFFHDNLAYLAASTVYIVVILTAMQVGLATDALASNSDFQSVSYRFAIFSILGPLGAICLLVLWFGYIFLNNLVASVAFKNNRFQTLKAVREA